MPPTSSYVVTELLSRWSGGDLCDRDALVPLVHDELRRIARRCLARRGGNHALQPTALVHEAYLRLVEQSSPDWQSRSHFYGVAARVMRQILVDHARRKLAKKRAGAPVTLQQAVSFDQEGSNDLVALDAALTDLEKVDERKCHAIELRYFAGLSMEEIAQAMNLSVQTVRRDLRMAEAWLQKELQGA